MSGESAIRAQIIDAVKDSKFFHELSDHGKSPITNIEEDETGVAVAILTDSAGDKYLLFVDKLPGGER